MLSTATDARMIRSRGALRDALLAQIETKPFDQITVREITNRAEVGYATFFRHYASKEALLQDLAVKEIGDLLAMCVPVLYIANSRESCRAMCAYVAERRGLWRALLTGGASSIVREEFIRQALQLAEREGRNVESWLPADLSVVWPTGSVLDILSWWLAQKRLYSSDQIAEIIDRLIIGPTMREAEALGGAARTGT